MSGMATAVIYVCAISSPAALGAVPEDSEEKKHHLKGGKGFTNPWESWREFSGPKIMSQMIG